MITVLFWPDGTWCYKHELEQMTHMSDDFKKIEVEDNTEYFEIALLIERACENE